MLGPSMLVRCRTLNIVPATFLELLRWKWFLLTRAVMQMTLCIIVNSRLPMLWTTCLLMKVRLGVEISLSPTLWLRRMIWTLNLGQCLNTVCGLLPLVLLASIVSV